MENINCDICTYKPLHKCPGLKNENFCTSFNKGQKVIANYPGTMEQLSTFTKAMIEYAKSGFINVDEKEQNRRLDICYACDQYIPENDKCLQCACIISEKTKMASEGCPLRNEE